MKTNQRRTKALVLILTTCLSITTIGCNSIKKYQAFSKAGVEYNRALDELLKCWLPDTSSLKDCPDWILQLKLIVRFWLLRSAELLYLPYCVDLNSTKDQGFVIDMSGSQVSSYVPF